MLTPAQYRNAIYLDFEGEGKKRNNEIPKPHMAGFFRPNSKGKSGKYNCIFFNKNWKAASNGIRAAGYEYFDTCFEMLAHELEEKDAYLVYWTIHEEVVLEKYLPQGLFDRLSPRLHNLHPIARTYANGRRIFGNNVSARNKTLEEFFEVLYCKRKPNPPLRAAEACRRIDKACSKHKKWKQFSEKQKNYVKDLTAYNQGDCRSTWLIAKKLGNFYHKKEQLIPNESVAKLDDDFKNILEYFENLPSIEDDDFKEFMEYCENLPTIEQVLSSAILSSINKKDIDDFRLQFICYKFGRHVSNILVTKCKEGDLGHPLSYGERYILGTLKSNLLKSKSKKFITEAEEKPLKKNKLKAIKCVDMELVDRYIINCFKDYMETLNEKL
jgi:hypothetical protein